MTVITTIIISFTSMQTLLWHLFHQQKRPVKISHSRTKLHNFFNLEGSYVPREKIIILIRRSSSPSLNNCSYVVCHRSRLWGEPRRAPTKIEICPCIYQFLPHFSPPKICVPPIFLISSLPKNCNRNNKSPIHRIASSLLYFI